MRPLRLLLALLLTGCAPSLVARRKPPPTPEEDRAPGTPKPPKPPEKQKPKRAALP